MCEPKSKPNRNNGNQEVLVASKSAAPCKDEEVTMDTVRKKVGKSGKDVLAMRTPPPPAVARRNARERNRVKQVNNGFANLRQHIPNSIAAAFESGTGRSGNKKLSKVETLRMAVEYIRSLEKVLGLNEDGASAASPTLSYQSGSLESHPEGSYRISLASPSSEDDSISTTNSATPPLPFVIGTDKFHIVPMHFLQSNALKVESDLTSSSLVEANSHHHHHHHQIEMKAAQLSQDVNTNVSLSPEIYSDGSLSPRTEGDIQNFIPVFNIDELSQDATASVKLKESSKTANEEMRILCRNLIMLQADAEAGKQPLNMNELISW